MILSKQHKFVFLRGQKVAGTSVEMALSAICGPDDIVSALNPIDERKRIEFGGRPAQNYLPTREPELEYIRQVREASPEALPGVMRPSSKFRHHMSYKELQKVIGEEALSEYFVFGIDRNPYAKVISLANMRQSYRRSYLQGGEMKGDSQRLGRFIKRLLRGNLKRIQNLHYYTDESGRLRAHILRYENLQAELDALVAQRGWPSPPPLPHAKKGVMANERDPREIFSREQLDRINELMADEFEQYGYPKL